MPPQSPQSRRRTALQSAFKLSRMPTGTTPRRRSTRLAPLSRISWGCARSTRRLRFRPNSQGRRMRTLSPSRRRFLNSTSNLPSRSSGLGRLCGQGDPSRALDLTVAREANSCLGAGCVKTEAPVSPGPFCCAGSGNLKASRHHCVCPEMRVIERLQPCHCNACDNGFLCRQASSESDLIETQHHICSHYGGPCCVPDWSRGRGLFV